ncbi:MAG: hypothetical protein LBN06_10295 [Prevotellaceae bacterium]|nr:hypothetical protein [Prevotellaceae bacterium]
MAASYRQGGKRYDVQTFFIRIGARYKRIRKRPWNVKVPDMTQLICLGFIALHESLSAIQLVRLLHLKDADALRPWLHPLIDKGLIVATDARTKAKEYRVNTQLLKNSQYKGRTSLKRIESYRLKELIVEDLKIYHESTLNEIQSRIGSEIVSKKIWEQMNVLITEGRVQASRNAHKISEYRILTFNSTSE